MPLTAGDLAAQLVQVGKPDALVVLVADGDRGEVNFVVDSVEEGDDPNEVWVNVEVMED